MKRMIYGMMLLPLLLAAQPKAEWTFYGPGLVYENNAATDKKLGVTGVNEVLVTQSGALAISSETEAIFFLKDGIDYSTGKMVFTKEKSKFSLVKGGETANALSMATTPNGDLWFGTKKGLYRIDYALYSDLNKMKDAPMLQGVRLNEDTPGMPFNAVSIIKAGKNGHLWVAGGKLSGLIKVEFLGISEYNGTDWKNFPVTGFEGKEVTAMALDQQDNPVVVSGDAFTSSTVLWMKDGQWKSLGAFPKGETVSAIAVGNNNMIYAGTSKGVYTWENDKWTLYPTKKDITGIKDIKVDQSNNVWIASDYGVYCVNSGGGEYDLTQSNSPLPINTVSKITVDSNNKKWFVTTMGILGFKEPQVTSNDNMTIYTKYNSGMFDGQIESIVPYKDGFLMSNHEIGLVSFDGKTFKALTPKKNSELFYNDAVVAKDGSAYMGTYRFIHKYDGKEYTKWEWKDDTGKQVNAILIDNKNSIWIGSDGISKYDGTAWQNFNKKNAGLSSNAVTGLFQDSKGTIWALVNDGVAKYDGTTWTSYTKKTTDVQLRNMTAAAETKDGKVLFTNGFTLAEFDGTAFKALDGFANVGTVYSMLIDEDGTLLLGTEEKGIARFKDGKTTFCDQATCGLPSNTVTSIYKHTDGKLWITCGVKPLSAGSGLAQPATAGQPGGVAAEPAGEAFNRKMKQFDTFFGVVQLNKR